MRRAISVALFFMILAAGLYTGRTLPAMADAPPNPFAGMVFLLDAGHGGADGGAVGITTGRSEAEVNLALCKKLRVLLESSGFAVYLTRETEADLCKGRYSKAEDMAARRLVAENVKPDFIVSIHLNSYPNPTVRGAQVFYYPGSQNSANLAQITQNTLKAQVDPTNKRRPKEADFFMLRISQNPSILVECGFLSCPQEEALLWDDGYQNKLAYALYTALTEYAYLAWGDSVG